MRANKSPNLLPMEWQLVGKLLKACGFVPHTRSFESQPRDWTLRTDTMTIRVFFKQNQAYADEQSYSKSDPPDGRTWMRVTEREWALHCGFVTISIGSVRDD